MIYTFKVTIKTKQPKKDIMDYILSRLTFLPVVEVFDIKVVKK